LGLLNLSVKGEYALLAVLDLAMNKSGDPVKIAAIASRQNIPQKFLELILASLKQGGFVESRRGAEGGYLLARPADRIRVGDVLRHIEGRPERNHVRGESAFIRIWQQAESALGDVLDNHNFADIARQWSERQSAYVPNWDI